MASPLGLLVVVASVMASCLVRWQRERHRHREVMRVLELAHKSATHFDVPTAIMALQPPDGVRRYEPVPAPECRPTRQLTMLATPSVVT